MSNFWTGYSNAKLAGAEAELVKIAGLSEDEFQSYPVKFTFTEKDWKEDYDEEDSKINHGMF